MYDKDTSTNTTPVQAFFQLVSSDWSIKASGTDNPASETVKSISGKLKAGTFTIDNLLFNKQVVHGQLLLARLYILVK